VKAVAWIIFRSNQPSVRRGLRSGRPRRPGGLVRGDRGRSAAGPNSSRRRGFKGRSPSKFTHFGMLNGQRPGGNEGNRWNISTMCRASMEKAFHFDTDPAWGKHTVTRGNIRRPPNPAAVSELRDSPPPTSPAAKPGEGRRKSCGAARKLSYYGDPRRSLHALATASKATGNHQTCAVGRGRIRPLIFGFLRRPMRSRPASKRT